MTIDKRIRDLSHPAFGTFSAFLIAQQKFQRGPSLDPFR